MSTTMTTAELTDRYLLGNYGRFPISFARGEGSWIWDEAGKKYLDFGCGIAVCSLGHTPGVMQKALSRQSGKTHSLLEFVSDSRTGEAG